MHPSWAKLVSGTWLLCAVWVLVERIEDLTHLPDWEGTAREHLQRYPSEITIAALAIIVAFVAAGSLAGSRRAMVALKWCCWATVTGAFALAISILAIAYPKISEALFAVAVLVAVGVAAALSVRVLRASSPGPV